MVTKERIKQLAHEAGFDACGITLPEPLREAEETLREWLRDGKHGEMRYLEDYQARKENFWQRFPDAKSVIVLGVNYYSAQVTSDKSQVNNESASSCGLCSCALATSLSGRVARYAWGKDYHQVISKKIDELIQRIKDEIARQQETRDKRQDNDKQCASISLGACCLSLVRFESSVDTKPLLERSLAESAGLGFIGKQTQLLSLEFGPWFFLSELVTNLELEPDQPFSGSCGTCRLCIDECPTSAIEESGTIDARKCIAYLTIEHKTEIPIELRSKIGNRVFGCDECLNVCPYTAKQKESTWDELKADAGFGSELDLARLFEIKSNREYEKLFGDTAISRANRKQLLRNACVVLGNSGSKEALPLLEKALRDSSPLVRAHAEWAIERISANTHPE